jgi:hypothetical protein
MIRFPLAVARSSRCSWNSWKNRAEGTSVFQEFGSLQIMTILMKVDLVFTHTLSTSYDAYVSSLDLLFNTEMIFVQQSNSTTTTFTKGGY